jgi:hypothetical protein
MFIDVNKPFIRAIVNIILVISFHFSILYAFIPLRILYVITLNSGDTHFIYEGFSVTVNGIKQSTFLLPESALALVLALLLTHYINKKL